jgi:hypothetical protein
MGFVMSNKKLLDPIKDKTRVKHMSIRPEHALILMLPQYFLPTKASRLPRQ